MTTPTIPQRLAAAREQLRLYSNRCDMDAEENARLGVTSAYEWAEREGRVGAILLDLIDRDGPVIEQMDEWYGTFEDRVRRMADHLMSSLETAVQSLVEGG